MNTGAFSGTTRRPGWNGFADVDAWATGSKLISTPGSNLALATTIIGNLSNSTRTLANAVLYFPSPTLGLTAHPVASGTGDTITLVAAPASIVEHYKLAWSSYALVADGNLTLYYNFSPTIGQVFSAATPNQVLLRNVSTFEFRGDGRTIRFKICVDEEIGEDFNITICKEKAVF